MRVISGFVAAAMLAALSQPAWAVCVNRGGVVTCRDDPKDWRPSAGPEKESSADDQVSSLKMIVLQPTAVTGDAAWVMTPESGDAAIKPASTNAAVPACELGLSC